MRISDLRNYLNPVIPWTNPDPVGAALTAEPRLKPGQAKGPWCQPTHHCCSFRMGQAFAGIRSPLETEQAQAVEADQDGAPFMGQHPDGERDNPAKDGQKKGCDHHENDD